MRPRALIAGLVGVALAATFGLLAGPATPLIVGLTVVLASALLFWQWPYAALLAMLVVRGGVPNIELPNLLIATGGALGLAFSGAPLPPKRITLPFVAFLALALFSVPLTPSGDIAPENKWLVIPIVDVAYFPRGLLEAREWLRVASILVICWLAFSVTRTTRDVQRVVAAVLLSGAVCVGWGLWQWVNGMTVVRQGFEGVAGPFTHASYYAHYLLVIIAIGLAALFTTGPRFLKLLVWVVLPGAVLCLFLSYSRAAWIGAVVIVAVMAVLEYRRIFVVLAIAVPLAIGFLPQVTANAERRFADLSPESGAATANSWNWRKDHWSRMRPLAFEKPLTGHGFGSYHAVAVNEYGQVNDLGGVGGPDPAAATPSKDNIKGVNAHNDYLKALLENGVPGVLLWAAILAGMAGAAFGARGSPEIRGYATALFALTVALMGISAVDNLRDDILVYAYLAAALGAVLGIAGRGRTNDASQVN